MSILTNVNSSLIDIYEYLTNDKLAFIKLPNLTNKFEISCIVNVSGNTRLFGTSVADGVGNTLLVRTEYFMYTWWQPNYYNFTYNSDFEFHISSDGNQFTFQDNEFSVAFGNQSNINLFAYLSHDDSYYKTDVNTSIKQFDLDTRLSLRPCKLKGLLSSEFAWDNQPHYADECGMWDSVNNIFYGNANSKGAFTVSGNKIGTISAKKKISYLAYATSNNQLVFPKKLYWANSTNSVQLVYVRPVKELHIINPSFYNNFQSYVSDITEIRLTSHMPNVADVVDNNIVNITHNNNSRFVKTYMWLTEDTNNARKYIGYIGSPWYDDSGSKFYGHGDFAYCFRDIKLTSLQYIINKLDTKFVTTFYLSFKNCSNLQSLDLSNLNVVNITTIYGMFAGCTNLVSVNLANWNTQKLTDMSGMFQTCTNILNVDLTDLNTSKVTNIQYMFYGCSKLQSVNLEGLDFSKVTKMNFLFYGCQNLTNLNESVFNTKNVTSLESVFHGCKSLVSLDLSNFDTSNVTKLRYMFYSNINLKRLILGSNFNTSKVTDMFGMFQDCRELVTLASKTFDLTSLETDNDTFMLYGLNSIVGGNNTTYNGAKTNSEYARIDGENGLPGYFTSPDYIEITNPSFLIKFPNYVSDSSDNLSALRYTNVIPNASEVVDNRIIEITAERSGARTFMWLEEDTVNTGKYIGYIGCKKYTNNCTIFVSGSMGHCFRGIKLTNIQNIIEQLDTSKVTDMSYCFYACRNLQVLDLSNWNTSNVTNMEHMFRSCRSLTSLDLSNFDTSNVTNMSHMFFECSGLLSLDVSNFNTSSVTNMIAIFANVGIAGMKSFNCSNFNTSNVKDMKYMFYYMTKVEKIICNTLDLTSLEADKDYWMFKFDHYLVGGNGTAYNNEADNYVDSTYARVDGENGLPGYFTDPATQAKITLMNSKNDGLKYLDYIDINSTYTIPTLEGYTAVVTDNNGNTYSDGDTITITQDITLTFVWSAVNNN